jgi:hypothetical protein
MHVTADLAPGECGQLVGIQVQTMQSVVEDTTDVSVHSASLSVHPKALRAETWPNLQTLFYHL